MNVLPPADPPPSASGILARLGAIVAVAVVAGLIVGLMAVPFVGSLGVVSRNVIQEFESIPDGITTPPLPQRTQILASDGSVIATLFYQNRVEIPLASVAPIMRQATVSVEDARFLDHNGVDLRGTLRALASNTSAGDVQQGGSTLTMQYVKNVLVNSATTAEELDAARGRSPARKVREMRFALGLERRYSKAEILERYLNIVYFGAGAYGVEAAARRYFSKPASALTLPEAATLAGIVQQPVGYDPLRNPDRSAERRNVVLKRMAALGFISKDEAERAAKIPMSAILRPTTTANGCTTSYAPFFCDYVLQTIRNDPAFGATPEAREVFLKRGGYVITTTLDPAAQRGATKAATDFIPMDDESQKAAAVSVVEPGTGNILAMTQNREWGTSGIGKTTYNYNVDRKHGGTIGMQAGSTFKVFTLAAALEAGISPFEYVAAGSPKVFTNFVECGTNIPFQPITVRNSTTSGTMDMIRATAYSTNTYFMSIEERTGLCRPAEIAESMGVYRGNGDNLLRVPSFTLGTMEVTPLAMANAYATFANHGIYCAPRVILSITDRDGASLPVPPPQCRQVLARDVADTVVSLLTGVVDGPIGGRTGARMSLDRPAAGKTGTTNESAAVWFCGFTADVAAAVWVGDPRGGFAYPMKGVTINGVYYPQVFGGTLPGPIWKASMEAALASRTPKDFQLNSRWGLRPARAVNGTNYGFGRNPYTVDPVEEFSNGDLLTPGEVGPSVDPSASADVPPGAGDGAPGDPGQSGGTDPAPTNPAPTNPAPTPATQGEVPPAG
ncbi:MAG: penicillin-binding protein [Actinomycetales bacterium]|nr:penicillin-binding protein [Actinomycetales bacterium]